MALGQALSRLGATALLLARQRLELASLDVEEELLRLLGVLAGVLAATLLLTLALAAAAAGVVAYFWDSARIGALVGVTVVFAAAGLALGWRVARALREKPRFMATTLAELEKDRELLGRKP